MELDAIARVIERQKEKLALVRKQRQSERTAISTLEGRLDNIRTAQELAQDVAQKVQQQVHEQVARMVSHSLAAVFEDPYTFRIVFEQKRGRTEARLIFERDGIEVDPMYAAGGGVVDVAAFALRLSCLLRTRPPVRRLLVLDEPFKFVSAEYRDRIRKLLETLSKEKGVQILMVTHIPELRTGKVIELGKVGG